MDLTIVVPAFNEENRLAPAVQELAAFARAQAMSYELIVVDDGSRDGTASLVHRLSQNAPEVRLIRLASNQGKGYAVRTGVVNGRGRLILFADADGATPASEFARLEAAIEAGADVAIGSRALRSTGVAVQARWYRRLFGRAFHLLVRTLTVKGIQDTQCGFKLFRGPVAHDLFGRMRMSGFSFDVEVLLMAQRQGYRIAEVPVNWHHVPGSRISLLRDSLRMARDLFIIRANAARGLYDQPHVATLATQA